MMNYNALLELATDLGYRLAMSGAETYRIEESISRVLAAYGIESEIFAIPNCLTVSIETPDGKPMTRMRRIGFHGNDLDSVERYNNLSRRICSDKPDPDTARQWLTDTDNSRRSYKLPIFLLGNAVGALGFTIFFGGTLIDCLCAAFCGIVVGLINRAMDRLKVNQFFSTIASAFIMAVVAYAIGAARIPDNTDTVVIGVLMLLVPGLIFTNAMRDIIFGDTNSGVNRIVQMLLVAAAIALGTGAGWNLAGILWGTPISLAPLVHPVWLQCLASFIGCYGFSILFNIHGPGGLLCALGGMLSWGTYLLITSFCGDEATGYFGAAVVAAAYSEIMARIRKYAAISYLVISIFPLIPGAAIYYATNHLVRGNGEMFAQKGMQAITFAGAIAVGILMVSTIVRLWGIKRLKKT